MNLASPTGYSSSGAIAAMNGLDSNPDAINGANISTINDGDQSSRLGQQPSVSSSSACKICLKLLFSKKYDDNKSGILTLIFNLSQFFLINSTSSH